MIPPLPQLPIEQETALIRRWQQCRDHAAAKAVVRTMTGYVRTMARKARRMNRTRVSYEDLEAAGLLGVTKALDRFDTERGLRFSTYAVPWIRAEVNEELIRNWTAVAIGKGKLQKLFWRLLVHDGEESTTFEFKAERMLVGQAELQHMLSVVKCRAETFGEDAPERPGPVLQSPSNPHSELEDRERERTLRRAYIQALTSVRVQDRMLLERRTANPEPDTMAAIARDMGGVSRQAIEQREKKMMATLRRKLKPSQELMEALA